MFSSDPSGRGGTASSAGALSAATGPVPNVASVSDAFAGARANVCESAPAPVAESRRSARSGPIVPEFGVPTICAPRVVASRSEKPIADGRSPVLPADALFSSHDSSLWPMSTPFCDRLRWIRGSARVDSASFRRGAEFVDGQVSLVPPVAATVFASFIRTPPLSRCACLCCACWRWPRRRCC